MKRSIGIAVILFVYSTASFASCTNSDLSGVWKLYGTIQSPSNVIEIPISCNLNMPAKGNVIKADSTCSSAHGYDGIDFSGTLSGMLKVDSKCHVTGQFSINIDKMIGGTLDPTGIAGINPLEGRVDTFKSKVDAFISKGKDSISGMMYEAAFTPMNGLLAIVNSGLISETLLPVINTNQSEFTSSSVFTAVKL